jgi:hypothetical protein
MSEINTTIAVFGMTPNISFERIVCKLRLHPSAHFNR